MSVLWGWISNKPFWQWSSVGLSSKSGVKINNSNALSCTAYYAGVSLISQTLGQVPLILYERLPRGKQRAHEHQLYAVLHDEPNPYMCAFTLKETLQGHLLTWGNAFAEIEWEPGSDTVRHLWPLRPDSMQIARKEGDFYYIYTLPNGEQVKLAAHQILHIPGFGFDGLIGYDPITLAREAIGLSKATEEFGSRFFAGGSQLSGVLKHPGSLSQQARDNMRQSWEEMHQGLSKQHRIAILEEGVDFQSIGVPPENAQFLETRRFQVSEVARFLHVPPHLIGDVEKSTSWGTGIEQQNIGFLQYTMMPWFARWEQSINRKGLSLADRQRYFSEFLAVGLMRGDSANRASYYKERFYMGSLSPNDIREKENENPIPGGDEYYVPLNMIPVGTPLAQPSQGNKAIELKRAQSGIIRYRTANAYRYAFAEAGKSIVSKEVRAIRKNLSELQKARKNKVSWFIWLDEFYERFADDIKKLINPAVNNLAESIQSLALEEVDSEQAQDLSEFLQKYNSAFVKRYIDSSVGQLKALTNEVIELGVDPAESIDQRLGEWEQRRPGKVAMNETVQLSNAVAKTAFAGAGVIYLSWQATGDKVCPICQEMDGRIVGIDQNFVNQGDTLESEGQSPMKVYKPTSHPPLHEGCVCVIGPA